ncbi:hypothetical protein FACS1894187_16180 [Synergistales bacterium]|nr:hypothetical protein FACS1894187_16180 [Synergistales bacterium]
MTFQQFLESMERDFVYLISPDCHFPVDTESGLWLLILTFVALYPLEESIIMVAEGKPHRLPQMLNQFKEWSQRRRAQQNEESDEISPNENVSEDGNIELPEMDNYSFIRPGLWWNILARDKWTCVSCGRSAKDGVTLHVDHIIPRSRGGTNDQDNLQTLCMKCNIGKSNRDATDLRWD